MRRGSILFLTLILGPLSPAAADSKQPKNPRVELEKTVRALGSRRFAEREQATKILLNAPSDSAIPLLKQALKNPDPEVARRAEDILWRLELRRDTDRTLTTRTLTLDYQEVPVLDAIDDLSRRMGLPIKVRDQDRQQFVGKRITLKDGEVSHWEALSRVCAAAGLAEPPPPAPLLLEHDVRSRGVVWVDESRSKPALPLAGLTLMARAAGPWPAHHAGALRVQAMPVERGEGRELTLHLLATLEPHLIWNRLLYTRLDRVIDNQGQAWLPAGLGATPEVNPLEGNAEKFILWDGYSEWPVDRTPSARVRLLPGTKPARKLVEVRGSLAAVIETPAEPLVLIDSLEKARDRTVTHRDGLEVRVRSLIKQKDGQYQLQVEVKPPTQTSNPLTGMGIRVIRINRGKGEAGMQINLDAAELERRGLSVTDGKGRPIRLATGSYASPELPTSPILYTLYYQPHDDDNIPTRLVCTGRRKVTVEVPFVLRDIPLP